jgi:xylulose-5-phosphate/fructose-6-phosphate phosphoketolase
MSANPHANGGMLKKALRLPDFRDYAVKVEQARKIEAENTRPLGAFLRDVMKLNMQLPRLRARRNTSNKLDAIYEVSKKFWIAEYFPEDADGGELAPDGRVMEMLSEHTMEGMLEGYLLTGRHGFLSSYEAFVHVIDSMFNQHAKWLSICNQLSWRRRHRVAEPADHLDGLAAGSQRLHAPGSRFPRRGGQQERRPSPHLSAAGRELPALGGRPLPEERELRQRDRLRQADAPAVPDMERPSSTAPRASASGMGQQRPGARAGCGDGCGRRHPHAGGAGRHGSAARRSFPDLKIRFVNVVDLFKLQPSTEHPHGLTDRDFDSLFTVDKPVIFNFHGYPWLIHRLAYRRTNHNNMHVRGYKEKGNINTPMELAINNEIDRFSLAIDAIDRTPRLQRIGAHAKERFRNMQIDCRNATHGVAGDQQLFIGGDHPRVELGIVGRDLAFPPRHLLVAALVELQAGPGEAFADPPANLRRILADAAGENHRRRRPWPPETRPGTCAPGNRISRWPNARAGRRALSVRPRGPSCRWSGRKSPAVRTGN